MWNGLAVATDLRSLYRFKNSILATDLIRCSSEMFSYCFILLFIYLLF